MDLLADELEADLLEGLLLAVVSLLLELLELLLAVVELGLDDLLELVGDLALGDGDPSIVRLALDPAGDEEIGERRVLDLRELRRALLRDGLQPLLRGGLEQRVPVVGGRDLPAWRVGHPLDDGDVAGRDVGRPEAPKRRIAGGGEHHCGRKDDQDDHPSAAAPTRRRWRGTAPRRPPPAPALSWTHERGSI